jgi:hypothetical protein
MRVANGGYALLVATCEVCGNDYDKAFEVTLAGESHVFDCFECAIHRLAPTCEHCGCKVIGHGAEVAGRFFCCAHCARESEGAKSGLQTGLADHASLGRRPGARR